MTIRDQVAEDIDWLWTRIADLREDPDISEELRNKLRRVSEKLASCMELFYTANDNGPTAADIAGEVNHVPAPF